MVSFLISLLLHTVFFYQVHVNAAVTLYGSLAKAGDSISCSSNDYTDTALAELLSIENSNEADRSGTIFIYKDVQLTCGSTYAIAVETSCNNAEGTATCNKSLLPRNRHVTRSSNTLPVLKREAYFCKTANQQCDDTIDANTFGKCPGGYKEKKIEVNGKVPGVICSRPCTDAQKATCLDGVCRYRRQQCDLYPASKPICGDALIKCSSPVAMREDICNDQLLEQAVKSKPINPKITCAGCATYSNGMCALNRTNFDAYVQRGAEADEAVLNRIFSGFE